MTTNASELHVSATEPSTDGSPVHVLYVDDDHDLVDLVTLFLESQNETISVTGVTTAEDALTVLDEQDIDCIVSDYQMPEQNGLQLLEQIREGRFDLPFILYTGHGSEEIAGEAIAKGVTEYMQKESGSEQYAVLANRILLSVQRHRANQLAEAERGRFAAVFERSSDAMILANNDGEYLRVNPTATRLFGRPESALLGKKPSDFTSEHFDFDTAWNSFLRTSEERGLFAVERPDGSIRIAEYVANTNVLPGVHLSVLRDVTEQYESKQQLFFEKERLKEFASVLSHDLKNPVQLASGHLELLQSDIDSASARESLEIAMEAVERIGLVIDDVLTMSNADGEGELLTTVEFSEVAETVWKRVRQGTSEATIEPGITIEADPVRLERLLTNLFRNAIEHGGTAVQIRVGRLADDAGFFIEDDGPGIPEDERQNVFSWGYSTKSGGSGIGLASIGQIVEAHEWDLSIVEGTEGGARFEIRL
ncbi:multi-sensor signal transduction histidine kinase [Haloferax elongans ATCC BAA-1513]|uniref:Multi-sensor signal transduction histidine kinase n=1 Tax=Haloferax elongans ATCC BAA-1513 TaxID=1230453 RepID=M0HMK0_HALEO|nr:response regulator [Haloferax elongans]ELZ85726.1 multi-sensor signal transduction histidine kinase [Haloferax elongans ATCC BAA-1513]